MQMKLLSVFSVFLIFTLERVSNFELTNTKECQSSDHQQSPININTNDVKYVEEKFFRILGQNFTLFNSTWKSFDEERTIGFSGTIGSLIFVKDWAMYKFDLKNVYIRYGPSHRIDGMKYDMEMEFVFDIDDTYRTPGRYIHPSSEKLILSYFFVVSPDAITNNEDDKVTLFFNYTNLEEFSKNTNTNTVWFTKNIKFNKLIKQQPSYFYEGSTTSGKCQPAWRVLMPKYQLIPKSQYNQIRTALSNLGYLENNNGLESNSRSLVIVNAGTQILRNEKDFSRLLIEASVDQYDRVFGQRLDIFVFAAILALLLLA